MTSIITNVVPPVSESSKWSLGDADYLNSVMYGNPAFFGFGISVNDKNSSEYIASVSHSLYLLLKNKNFVFLPFSHGKPFSSYLL